MRLRLLGFCLIAAALFAAAPMARANEDAVHFFSDIRVPADSSAHDAVCFFCSVYADGEINGNVVVFFGNVHVGSIAHHDVVNFFGGVTAADHAVIEHDLVNFFGSVRLGENTSVSRDMVSMFGMTHIAPSASVHGNSVTFPFWLFGGPMLLMVLAIYVIVREMRERRFRREWMASQAAMGQRV